MPEKSVGSLHHVELWVPNLQRASEEWGWLLSRLGYLPFQEWSYGRSWQLGPTYIVLEESPHVTSRVHERTRPGLNHLAFNAGSETHVDLLARECRGHGWKPLFEEKYPNAGGSGHYAAYLANSDGFEAELVAG